jgi:hypothetical protein
MDAGEVTDSEVDPEVLELALQLAREQRDEFILWMSVQVLMTDTVATADEVLSTVCAWSRTAWRTCCAPATA